jgi:phosphoglycerate dehydrogenase-like enzyme
MVGAVSAVAPAALEDDFDLARDADGVLDRIDLQVAADPGPEVDGAEILITGLTTQTTPGAVFAAAMPRLRWVHSLTAGIEDLVSEELLRRGVVVTNGAGAYATAIAEYAFAAMVMLARSLPQLVVAHAEGGWVEEHPLGSELAGKRVGIVGYGGIGRAVAGLCCAAGMSVWGLRRRPAAGDQAPAERVLTSEDLSELLAESDFIVLAASLNTSIRGLLGPAEFEAIKPGACLVNLSRGALIDEAALASALKSGRLAGAVIDVTVVEPLPQSSELWRLPNLLITPHMSGGSRESRDRAFDILLANLGHYLAGHPEEMANVVDLKRELG